MTRIRSRSRDRGRRMLGALAAVVVLPLALGACVGIPRDGQVEIGQPDTSDRDLEVDFLPSGPTSGASQQEIVTGFIDAASSPQNNYKIAREFLSSGAEWSPSDTVIVDQGQRTQQQVSDTSVNLTITPVAQVDASGIYTEAAPASPVALTFKFVEQGGEWRISQPPAGVVIDRATFDQVFSAHPLYFFDPGFTSLVPDVRWFPSRADTGTSTTIVTELLAGPSPWLASSGAVATAFPAGTALASEAVPVVDQQAVVDLNGAALDADDRDRQLMELQLSKSLLTVSSVTGVTITIEQNPAETVLSGSLPTTPRVDSRALVLDADGFGFVSGDGVSGVPGLSGQIEQLEPDAVTVDASRGTAAVRAADGVHLLSVTGGDTRLDQRSGLIAPSLDPQGYVWTVPQNAPDQLIVDRPDGAAGVQIPTPWSEADSIRSFVVSRDGTRAVVLVADGTQTSLLAVGITRTDDGAPTALGEPVALFSVLGTPVVANWIDDSTAVAVVRDSQGVDRVWSQQLGGKRVSLGSTADVVAIAGGNTVSQLRVLTGAGELQQQRGDAWQTTLTAVDAVATQIGTLR